MKRILLEVKRIFLKIKYAVLLLFSRDYVIAIGTKKGVETRIYANPKVLRSAVKMFSETIEEHDACENGVNAARKLANGEDL